MKIYRNGYYYRWGEKEQLLFSKRLNVDINTLNAIVKDAIGWELFNSEVFEGQAILTSKGIQKRYLDATKRRQKVELNSNYLLLGNTCLNEYANVLIVNIKDDNADITTQSKVKESKGKESKGNNKFTPPTIPEIRDYCKERNNNIDPEHFHAWYSAKGWMLGKNKMKDWKQAVITWEKRNNDSGKSPQRKEPDYT
jgi:hypothetical protein